MSISENSMKERGKEIMKSSLEQLGLSQAEISMYQAALTLGPRPASVIAKTVGLQRTRAYDVLQSLENRGLVERIEKNKVRYFSPKSPARVLSLLDERRNLVAEQMKDFKSALPDLLGNLSEQTIDCDVRRFRGVREVKDALTNLIEDNEDAVYCIGDIEQGLRQCIGMSHWAKEFTNLRLKNRTQLNLACNGAPNILVENNLLRRTLYNPTIPTDMIAVFSTDQLICLSLDQSPSGTAISSKFVVCLLKSMHDAWAASTANVQ
jgi:predicted transcriptional regulator